MLRSGEPRGGPAASDDRGHPAPGVNLVLATYSQLGQRGSLKADWLCRIAETHGAQLLVDESHNASGLEHRRERQRLLEASGRPRSFPAPPTPSAGQPVRVRLGVARTVPPGRPRFLAAPRRRAVAGGVLADAGRGRRADPARARSVSTSPSAPNRTPRARTAIGELANRSVDSGKNGLAGR